MDTIVQEYGKVKVRAWGHGWPGASQGCRVPQGWRALGHPRPARSAAGDGAGLDPGLRLAVAADAPGAAREADDHVQRAGVWSVRRIGAVLGALRRRFGAALTPAGAAPAARQARARCCARHVSRNWVASSHTVPPICSADQFCAERDPARRSGAQRSRVITSDKTKALGVCWHWLSGALAYPGSSQTRAALWTGPGRPGTACTKCRASMCCTDW
jgi:hypothetical protein